MSNANAIPDSWTLASLEELVRTPKSDIVDGPFGSNLKASEYVDDGVPIIRLQNIGRNKFLLKNMRYMTEQKARDLSRHSFGRGDIVISKLGDPLGEACIVPDMLEHGIIVADVVRVRLPEGIFNKQAIVYALNSQGVQAQFRRLTKGTTRPRVNLNHVRGLHLPIPPRTEQDRIVAEIEKQFTRLDAAVAALKRVRVNLKRYRAAVLKAACEGRLVPSETELARNGGRSYETGVQLLARMLKERRAKWEADQLAKLHASGKAPRNDDWKKKYKEPEPPDATNLPSLPQGWTWATIRQVGQVQLGRQRAPQHHKGQYMRPYLRVANVFEDRIDISDVMEMNFTPSEFGTYQLHDGDVLLNEGQSLELIGRPAIYRNQFPGACFQNTLVRFRAFEGIEPRYALAVFLSYLHNQRFQKIAKWTTNIAHLGAERFADLEFPLPPTDEQRRIADTVEDRVSVLRNMETSTGTNSKRADRLRESILKRAFEGKLVPQDPNDELASVLLEGIRNERARAIRETKQFRPKRKTKVAVEVS